MIPVRTIDVGRAPALAHSIAPNVDLLEHGLRATSVDLVIGDDVVIDVLAHDLEGRPVLILVEDGPGEQLFQRAATAVIEFRRTAGLFHALNPERGFDVHETPRVLLVARRICERTEALLALLKIPSLKTFECTVVDSASGFQLVVTSRNATPPVRVVPPTRKEADEPVHALAGNSRAGFTAEKPAKRRDPPRVRGGRPLFEAMKERLLRVSPDVLEECDGDVVSFRIGENLLAQITRKDGSLLVSTGGDPWAVDGEDAVASAMDAVFLHFFNLQTTRRRIASLELRETTEPQVDKADQSDKADRTSNPVKMHGDGDVGRQAANS